MKDKQPSLLQKAAGPRGAVFMVLVACLAALPVQPARPEKASAKRVAVILSSEIRPYVEAAEGLNAALAETLDIVPPEVFSLDKYPGKALTDLAGKLAAENFDLMASIGPAASRFLWAEPAPTAGGRLYCMVLNPEKVLDGPERCGISLNIPVATQLAAISRGLPAVRRLGLLFDPLHNASFFAEAALAGTGLGLGVFPLRVSAGKEIADTLAEQWSRLDALWLVPDRTVISEAVVRYIIREALFKRVPVIGYNRFFYDSGAALAFIMDYQELGRQAGGLGREMLAGGTCRTTPPVFHAWLNPKVLARLGLQLPEAPLPPLEIGP